MGAWVEAVELKARIIHEQLAAAQALAEKNGQSPREIAKPYFQLLNSLYEEEFVFAQLADSSDLVARFTGPSVSDIDPTVTIVTSVFSDLRDQIRGIAKAIVGLGSDSRVRWPSELDPHLSGLAHGSLVIGINISKPDEQRLKGQMSIEGVSDQLFESVRSAVRSLSTVARFIGDQEVSESIRDEFPDPAIRDTVMVAASKLAPSGRKGIDGLTFYGQDLDEPPKVLTPRSRKLLNQALQRPVSVRGSGSFQGIVREIDLDARRFEIRQVQNAGAIRCVYGPDHNELVRTILDAQVQVSGVYETLPNRQPRLIEVTKIEIIHPPSEQLAMDNF